MNGITLLWFYPPFAGLFYANVPVIRSRAENYKSWRRKKVKQILSCSSPSWCLSKMELPDKPQVERKDHHNIRINFCIFLISMFMLVPFVLLIQRKYQFLCIQPKYPLSRSFVHNSGSRLLWSWLMLSAAYCYLIA